MSPSRASVLLAALFRRCVKPFVAALRPGMTVGG